VLVLVLQPTNHLDLEACVWLEDYLSKFKRILLMVSHRCAGPVLPCIQQHDRFHHDVHDLNRHSLAIAPTTK
jgi:hypothetical protein